MVRRPNGRRAGLILCSFLATLAFALPAAAQGLVQGVVTDTSGLPVLESLRPELPEFQSLSCIELLS